MVALTRSLRPQEWIKNLLVFAGLLFSGQVDEADQVFAAFGVFIAFCAMSSAGYLFNDIHDADLDRRHPEKRNRPLASGELSVETAAVASAALAVAGIAVGLLVDAETAGLVALYGVITSTYTIVLKRLVIIDVMTIASLFLLRVVAGAVAVDAHASEFLLLCTGMLALFLGFTKRRQEALMEMPAAASAPRPGAAGSAESVSSRPVLEHYSIPFLDQMIAMVTAAAIISYAIYAIDSPLVGSKMLATAPSVVYGVFRYLYLIYDRHDTRSTAAILTEDPGMVFAGLSWIGAAVAVLYVFD
jgi:UbiA prenyltransferase family